MNICALVNVALIPNAHIASDMSLSDVAPDSSTISSGEGRDSFSIRVENVVLTLFSPLCSAFSFDS